MLAPLNYIQSLRFTTDVSYFQFLNRIHDVELSLSSHGLWDVPHPWLNLFIPRSSILDFNTKVIKQLINQDFSGPILVYPVNRDKYVIMKDLLQISHPLLHFFLRTQLLVFQLCRFFCFLFDSNSSFSCRWDTRASAVIPDESMFYLVAFLRNALPSSGPSLKSQMDDNSKILSMCHDISCKQYFPTYNNPAQWEQHFGSQWQNFVELKQTFDPHAILAPGQNIFQRNQILASPSWEQWFSWSKLCPTPHVHPASHINQSLIFFSVKH